MNHEFAQIIGGARWLMEPKAFRAMVKRAETATADAIQAAVNAYVDRPPSLNMMGDVAVISMCGPITYKRSWFSMFFGGATIEDMQTQFRMALRDDSVKTITFRADSPGGEVTMIPEFADEIFAARGQKPIITMVDPCMCSAALWLGAQADAIHVSASSQVGSVGVYLEHESIAGMLEKLGIEVTLIAYGEHKTDGNSYQKLSDEAKASLQEDVNDVGVEFDGAMARGRGVSRKVVADAFGQGKVFRGKKIIAAGLADKMGTFAQVMGKLTKGRSMAAVSVPILMGAGEGQPLGSTAPKIEAVERTEMVEPEDGECPEGYEMGEDGMCHLMDEEGAKATASASLCQCVSCGRSSCPCQAQTAGGENCPDDCPTCSAECGCSVQRAAQAATDVRNPPMTRCNFCGEDADDCGGHCDGARTAQAAADDDALAIALALTE